MASPLQILGDIAGGLSTIGAQGSGGAYEGVLEGEALKRRFSASDADTNLRILQGLLMQQQLGPQFHTDPQGRTFLIRPGQPPQFWGFSPPAPPTPTQQAQMEKYTKEAKLAETRTNALQNPKDAKVESPIVAIERKVQESPLGVASLGPGEKAIWDAHHRQAEQPKGAGHFVQDAQGNVTEIRPDGTTRSYPKIGKPEKPTEGPLGPARFLTKAVTESLIGKGIDPRTATAQQIAAAQKEAEQKRGQSAIEQTRAKLEVGRAEKALTTIDTNLDRLNRAEDLANRQEQLSRELAQEFGGSWGTMVRTPIQAIAQHAPFGSKLQDKLAEFETINGQFASVALGVEGLTTTGRLAVQNVQRALSFHAKPNEPLSSQLARIGQLRRAISENRAILGTEQKREQGRLEELAPKAKGPGAGELIDLGDQ